MANFCGSCGSQLTGAEAFCWKCGAPVQPGAPQRPATPPLPPSQPPPSAPYQPAYAPVPAAAPPAAPAAGKSSTWITVLVVVIAVIFLGGLVVVGGLIYVGHRVSQKVHELSAEAGVSGVSGPSSDGASQVFTGTDACRLLSREDVSSAVGIEIVATKALENGCEYLAKGTASDMTARHMAALSSGRGADNQQQEMIHKFAGGIFANQQAESHQADADSNGNTPVFVFAVDRSGGAATMKATAGVMGMLGPGQQHLDGIGDEALDESGAMMLVRKGDKLIRIMYTSCPCGTDAIKPLAQKLADKV